MGTFKKPDWLSYSICGGVAVLLSWIVTGCRFGSRVETLRNPDQISGYYLALPQSLTFYATTTDTFSKEAPISLIPSEISRALTNPVALIVDDLATGSARFISPTQKVALPIFVNPDLSLFFMGKTTPSPFLDDPNCLSHLEIHETGQAVRTQKLAAAGSSLPISGKIQLTLRAVTQLKGNCSSTLQFMQSCLEDYNRCGASRPSDNASNQGYVLNIFAPWIEAEVLKISDISHLANLAYEVIYE